MVLLEIGCSTIVSKIAGAFQLVATCLVTASAGKDLLEERRKKLAIDFIFAGAYVGQEVEEAQAARSAYPQLVHCQQLRILKTGHDLGKGLFGSVVCALVQAGICRPKNAALKFPRDGGPFSLSVKQQSLVADLVKAASLPRCQQTPGVLGWALHGSMVATVWHVASGSPLNKCLTNLPAMARAKAVCDLSGLLVWAMSCSHVLWDLHTSDVLITPGGEVQVLDIWADPSEHTGNTSMMPAYLREGGAHRRACLTEIPRAELSKDLACFLGASLFAMLWLGPLCPVEVYECRKPAASCIELPPVLQQLHDGDKGSLQPALLSVEAGLCPRAALPECPPPPPPPECPPPPPPV